MRRAAGFTLIELVVIIVLIGVIAVYAAPRFDRSGYDAAAAADEVVEAIRYAQVLAMEHSGRNDADGDGNADYYGFRIVGNGYTVAIADSNGDVSSVGDLLGVGNYSESWGSEITLGANVAIYFNAFGEPVSAAGAALGSQAINVTSGSQTLTVRVEALTGYAYR